MNRRPYDRISPLVLGLSALVALGGCSKSLTASTQDQSMLPGQVAAKAAPQEERRGEAPTEPKAEVRVTEPSPEVAARPAPVERAPERPAEQPAAKAAEQPTAVAAARLADLVDVFFDYDKFSLRIDASPTLDADARLLKAENGWKLVIAGHCDERGTSAYNLVLGERRAQTVKKYLEDLGLSAAQMQVTSYGKEKPFCTEHNQECWQKNRRAHFSIQ